MGGRRRVLHAAIAVSIAWLAAPAWAQDAATSTVQGAARDWLTLTDRGDGGASWDAAGTQFRGAITRERWSEALASVRTPVGALEQRTVLSTSFQKSFPGAPDGDYAIVVFRTSFAKKADGRETVTLEREADGKWHVVGYFIK
jgi:hypothetical protein